MRRHEPDHLPAISAMISFACPRHMMTAEKSGRRVSTHTRPPTLATLTRDISQGRLNKSMHSKCQYVMEKCSYARSSVWSISFEMSCRQCSQDIFAFALESSSIISTRNRPAHTDSRVDNFAATQTEHYDTRAKTFEHDKLVPGEFMQKRILVHKRREVITAKFGPSMTTKWHQMATCAC